MSKIILDQKPTQAGRETTVDTGDITGFHLMNGESLSVHLNTGETLAVTNQLSDILADVAADHGVDKLASLKIVFETATYDRNYYDVLSPVQRVLTRDNGRSFYERSLKSRAPV